MLINRPAGQNLQKRQEKNQTGIMSAEYNDYNLKNMKLYSVNLQFPFLSMEQVLLNVSKLKFLNIKTNQKKIVEHPC